MSRTSAVNQIVRSLSIPNNDLSSISSPTQYEEGSEWGDGLPLPFAFAFAESESEVVVA